MNYYFETISKGRFPMGSRDQDQNQKPGQQNQGGHKPGQQNQNQNPDQKQQDAGKNKEPQSRDDAGHDSNRSRR